MHAFAFLNNFVLACSTSKYIWHSLRLAWHCPCPPMMKVKWKTFAILAKIANIEKDKKKFERQDAWSRVAVHCDVIAVAPACMKAYIPAQTADN